MHMGVERNCSKPRGKVYGDGRKNRRRQKKPAVGAVQRLYEACREVFADCGPGVVPPADKIELLKSVLDTVTGKDVGVSPDMPILKSINAEGYPRITYLHIYKCDRFSIGIFCLPPTGVIPLHNHPEMTVFSKILFGTLHIKSYDWAKDASTGSALLADPSDGHSGGARLAKVKVNSEFTAPCNTNILFPADGGNMHRFTAKTPCAVLDVLGPPYSDPAGRHCQHYLDSPLPKFTTKGLKVSEEERDGYAWLEEIERPKEVTMVGALYNGPGIVEKC